MRIAIAWLVQSLALICLHQVATALTFRSWVVPEAVKFGDLKRLVLCNQQEESTTASNSYNEPFKVRVATKAVGLNFADIFTVLGYYKAANLVRQELHQKDVDGKINRKKKALGAFCPGLEFSGVLLDDCPTNNLKRGDPVYGFTRFGAYSDMVTTSRQNLKLLPDTWSYEAGASFLVNALTAWYGLMTVAGLSSLLQQKGSSEPCVVVVHSASGGVGLWASEIAARSGAIVVGIVGHEDKVSIFDQRIRPLCKAAQCIVRSHNRQQFERDLSMATIQARVLFLGSSIAIPEEIKNTDRIQPLHVAKAGWGADVVMESYGGQYFQASLDIVNAGGSMATFGSTTYNGSGSGSRIPFLPLVWKYLTRPRIDPGVLPSRNVRVGGFNLIFLTENTQALTQALKDCVACLSGETGTNKEDDKQNPLAQVTPPTIGRVHDFGTGAVEALSSLRSGRTVGKVVLKNADNPLLVGKELDTRAERTERDTR